MFFKEKVLRQNKISGFDASTKTLNKFGCKVCPSKNAKLKNGRLEAGGVVSDFYLLKSMPSKRDDRTGEHFSDSVSREILRNLSKKKVRLNYLVRCNSKTLDNRAVECCRKSIEEDIEKTKPKVIIGFGDAVLSWMLRQNSTYLWRGKKVPVKIGNHTCWYFHCYDPQFVLDKRRKDRNGNTYPGEHDFVFKLDLKKALDCLNHIPHVEDLSKLYDGVEYVFGNGKKDLKKIASWFDELSKKRTIGIDIETTGLRPYNDGQKILSVSIGTYKHTVVFPVEHPEARWTRKDLKVLKKMFLKFLLTSKEKIAHRLTFEQEWLSKWLGNEILRGTSWGDTKIQAFLLDEKPLATSLNFLCLQHFGFHLKEQSPIDVKNLINEPLEEVLKYNSLDTKYTHPLNKIQLKLMDDVLIECYRDRLLRATPTVVLTQQIGLVPNIKAAKKIENDLAPRLKEILEEMNQLPVVKKFIKRYGEFNPGSNKHVPIIFRDMLKCPEGKRESASGYSTDESVLKKIDHPLAKLLLDERGVSKLLSTYIEPILSGQVIHDDGLIHTVLHLLVTSTGRLCVAKGTMIQVVRDFSKNPKGIPIEEVKTNDLVYTFDDNLDLTLKKILWAGKTGHKKVVRIHWQGQGGKYSGHVDVTPEHKLRLISGKYKKAKNLKCSDRILAVHPTSKQRARLFVSGYKGTVIYSILNHSVTRLEFLKDSVDVYDLEVEGTHNFIGNELCLHNSSSEPNIQNYPKRKYKYIRKVIKAPKGFKLVSFDYGQIEARVIGMASKDKVFCKALWEDYDVHMEWAERIAHKYPKVIGGKKFLKDKETMKTLRSDVKNQWVFPLFFGSSVHSVSRAVGLPSKIASDLYDEFWSMFEGVHDWQGRLDAFYKKHGYVQTLNGRRRHAPMSYNERINQPIQGTACLAASTLIPLVDGQEKTIKELADSNEVVWIYSYCHKTKDLTLKRAYAARLTIKKAGTYKITYDNGAWDIATDNHPFLLRDGKYRQVKNLKKGDALMPCYLQRYKTGRMKYVSLRTGKKRELYRLTAEIVAGRCLTSSEVPHHINKDVRDDRPENILILNNKKEHNLIHGKDKAHNLNRHGKNKHHGATNCNWRQDITIDMILSVVSEGGHTKWSVAKKLDCDVSVVKDRLKRHSIPEESIGLDFGRRKKLTFQEICNAYTPTMPLHELVAILGYRHGVISRVVKEEGYSSWREFKKTYSNLKVKSIEFHGKEDVYDLSVEDTSNFALSSGVFVHNSDIVVDGMTRLSEKGIQACMNVHDDLTFLLEKKNMDKQVHYIAREMCLCDFDFINVPLTVEVEIGNNWYNQKEFARFSSEDFK